MNLSGDENSSNYNNGKDYDAYDDCSDDGDNVVDDDDDDDADYNDDDDVWTVHNQKYSHVFHMLVGWWRAFCNTRGY